MDNKFNAYDLMFTQLIEVAKGKGSRAAYAKSAIELMESKFGGEIDKVPNALAVAFASANAKRLAAYAAGANDEAARFPAPQVCVGGLQLLMNKCCWAMRRYQAELDRAAQQVASGEAASEAEVLNFAEDALAETGIQGAPELGETDVDMEMHNIWKVLANVRMFMYKTLNKNRNGDIFDLEDIVMFNRTEVVEIEDEVRWETVATADTWSEALECMAEMLQDLRKAEEASTLKDAQEIDFSEAC